MATGKFTYPIRTVVFHYQDGQFDLNNPPSWFCILQTSEYTANTPPSLSGSNRRGLVINCPYGDADTYYSQVFISQVGIKYMFIRYKKSGTWSDWSQIQTDCDFVIDGNISAGSTVTFTDSRINNNSYVNAGASYFGTPHAIGSKVTYTTNGTYHTVKLTGTFLGATTVHLVISHSY